MKPLWPCDVCGESIHPFSDYVVLQFSWRTTRNEHMCGECYTMILAAAYSAMGSPK